MIHVEIDDSGARAKLAALGKALDPARVIKTATYSVRTLVRSYLQELNEARSNRAGGPRSYFYNKARQSVHAESDDRVGIVSISQLGFAQRLYGGEIHAVNCRFLCIPINAAAYGKRMRDIPRPAPIRRVSDAIRRRPLPDGARIVIKFPTGEKFFLVQSVMQQPDRTVLPSDAAMMAQAAQSVERMAERAATGISPKAGE